MAAEKPLHPDIQEWIDAGLEIPETKSETITYKKVDLSGKTAIVTGANSGIGYITARDLVLMGARVIMACRSPTKAKAAMDQLKKEVGEEKSKLVEFMALDLSSLQSVMDFVEEFKKKGYPLHLLICNAGGWFNQKGFTTDGFEKTFETNYLSHFLLTLHLLPVMRNSGADCRIIYVSSAAYLAGTFDLENLKGEKSYSGFQFYNNSKLFQVMQMFSLQKRLADTNIRVFSLHPGGIDTPILNDVRASNSDMDKLVQESFNKGLLMTPEEGAVTTLMAATLQHERGALFFYEGKLQEPVAKAKNEEDQEKLWKYSLEQLKKYTNAYVLKGLE